MRKVAISLAAAVLMVAGCQTTDPYTGEQKTSNTSKGAIFGALGGAVVGALTNTSSGTQAARNALIGAGVGALAGGAVGNYMDRQEAALRQRLAQTGVGVRRVGNDILLVMPGNITFKTDSSDVNSSFYPVLSDVSLVLKEFDKTTVEVMGHTDSDGSDAYNESLSQKRANSVSQYLVSQGVMPQRLVVIGYGETRPVAPNTTPDGKQQNRRVEIQISPLTNS
ncbi:MAG: OmpA family protein [Alphaproteobacteria bacterium]|nr:OmpA family protein [Alphaproteobacteria bacterium]